VQQRLPIWFIVFSTTACAHDNEVLPPAEFVDPNQPRSYASDAYPPWQPRPEVRVISRDGYAASANASPVWLPPKRVTTTAPVPATTVGGTWAQQACGTRAVPCEAQWAYDPAFPDLTGRPPNQIRLGCGRRGCGCIWSPALQ
jgi:hypothetical protein